MKYTYRCPTHGHVIYEQSIKERTPAFIRCPECGLSAKRDYRADIVLGIHLHCQGFHKTDYDADGDKLEKLNTNWSRYYGEKPPKHDPTVPRNSGEKY